MITGVFGSERGTIQLVLRELCQHQLLHVEATASVDLGSLRLRIQPGLAFDEIDSLLKRRDAFPFELRVEPRSCVEGLQLLQREIRDVPGLQVVRSRGAPLWKHLFDVRRALQRQVVQADQDSVFRDLQVLLDEVRSLLDSEPIGGERVLGRICRRTAVSDENLP